MRLHLIWAAVVLLAVVALAVPPAPVPLFWIVRGGQSLGDGSVGYCSAGAYPDCITGAAYGNVQLAQTNPSNGYPAFGTTLITLAPQAYTSPRKQSSAVAMANQMSALSGRIIGTVDYGWPGASYGGLKKNAASCTGGAGTPDCYFNDSIGSGTMDDPGANMGVVSVAAIVAANPSTWSTLYVPAVYFNQGEAEMNSTTSAATYEGYMVELQSDYQTSINTAAAQGSALVPLFIRQKSSWPVWSGTPRTTPTNTSGADGVPIGQLQACLDHYSDGTIFCLGPDYVSTYSSDGIHRTQPGYVDEGGREGWIMDRVLRQRVGVRPFYPRAITITSATMRVQFWPPNGALTLNTTLVAAATNSGFELGDTDGTGITILSVALTAGSTDSVDITLSGAPAADKRFELRYAWTAPNGTCAQTCATGTDYSGPVNGPRGNVADSGGTSWNGGSLTNFANTFRIPNISGNAPHSWAPADPDLSTIPGPASFLFPLPINLKVQK